MQEKYHQPLVLLDNVNNTGGTVLSELNIPKQVEIVSYQSGYKYDYYHMKASDYGKIKNNLWLGAKRENDLKRICIQKHIPVLDMKQNCQYITYKLKTRGKSYRERYEWESLNARRLARFGLMLCENGYIQFPETDARNIFAVGYFQSEKYFADIKDRIRQEVQPRKMLKPDLQSYVTEIQNSDFVCLSLRMGDYLNNPVMGVCTPEYYQRAIDRIYQMHQKTEIYICLCASILLFQIVVLVGGRSIWENIRIRRLSRRRSGLQRIFPAISSRVIGYICRYKKEIIII